jgi:flagellar basal-body rod modification protein FlgD
MLGKVGQGGSPMMQAPKAGDSMANGMDFQKSGIEVGTSVKVGSPDGSAPSTEPKFSDVWKNLQAQFGNKAEKPREIKKTLGKDDFLKLMITQMKYQDPQKPFEMEKMGAEMAQLSSMEQLQNLNQTMKQFANRDQPVERMAMTGMIGKLVTVDRARFPHAEGESNALKFGLPTDAARVSVTVIDGTGAPLIEQELGPHKKGEQTWVWDGRKSNTLPAKSGNYTYQVKAFDSAGAEIKIPNSGSGRVVGVSFEGQKPVLLVGDSANPEKVFMENISRVVDDGGLASASAAIPGARPLSSAVAGESKPPVAQQPSPQAAPAPLGNFFQFTKGEGSKAIDPGTLSADDQKAIEGFRAQARANLQQQMDLEAGQGFPNGLSSKE